MVDRTILVSDLHIDEWNGDVPVVRREKQRAFLDFLSWVAAAGRNRRVGRFCILGDVVDVPPQQSAEMLMSRYAETMAGLQAILDAGIEVRYIIGNHDVGLVGLSLPPGPLEAVIAYPYTFVESGGRNFILEHGHLYDPWLLGWVSRARRLSDYVGQLAQTRSPSRAPLGGSPLTSLAMADVIPARDGRVRTDSSPLWHSSLRKVAPEDAMPTLEPLLSEDLNEDYSDVMDPRGDSGMNAVRRVLRQILSERCVDARRAWTPPVTSLPRLEHLARAYYAGPHWRRAAKERLLAMSEQLAAPIAGIVMGHTHSPDVYDWVDTNGPHRYVNSGSWCHDSGDIVIVADGVIQLIHRRWGDPLPSL